MTKYSYSIDDGETWSVSYKDVDSAKAAAIQEYRTEVDETESFAVRIGTVKDPIDILRAEKERWAEALLTSMQDILEEAMPFVDDEPIMEVIIIKEDMRALQEEILYRLELSWKFTGFLVEDVQEYIIGAQSCSST